MAQGNGVSINVGANTTQATQQINKLQQTLGKFGSLGKGLFGGQSAQQAQQYTRHLQNIERNLERVTMRVKTLQGAQQKLLDQQKQFNAAGIGNSPQANQLNKAIHQNQRSLNFWQAKQMGVQAQQQVAQGNRPGIGGGGGGILGFMGNQAQSFAGGLGGGFLKMAGIGAITGGITAVVIKSIMTAVDEQKAFADMMPGLRVGRLGGTKSQGFLNNFRDKSMPLGYSGLEALQVAEAMKSGSSDTGIQNDSLTAMKMGRMFGIDAGGQASMLAEGGKTGAFRPGDARRFAEMLAREIEKTGMGGRAQEAQEATLALLHQQAAASGSSSPSAAMAMQTVLARTGLPGLQGQMGGSLISKMNNTFGGAEDDATIAFQEAMFRDQRGQTGYYNLRRGKERIQAGKDPRYMGDAIKEAYSLTENDDAAKDLLSRVLGIPMIMLDEIGKRSKGGLRGMTSKSFLAAQKGLKFGKNGLEKGAADAAALEGNKIRQIEATVNGVLARAGTPMVKGLAGLGSKAAAEITELMSISDHSKSTADLLRQLRDHFLGWNKGGGKEHGTQFNPLARGSIPAYHHALAAEAAGLHGGAGRIDLNTGKPVGGTLPPGVAARVRQLYRNRGTTPPVLPHVPSGWVAPAAGSGTQHSSNEMHIYLHHDAHGALHPHVKHQIAAVVEEAVEHNNRKNTKAGLHHRYSRVG